MKKPYFIIMNHPNGNPVPITTGEHDNVALYKTKKEAQKIADDLPACQAYGYEVFCRGNGE